MRKRLDADATREAILTAALESFSERGYGATSISQVASRAKVTKSLVLYHFESKETLWQTTLEAHVRPMVQLFLKYANGDPSLSFRDVIRTRFDFMKASPHLSRLMTWLTLESAPLPIPIDQIAPRVFARAKAELHDSGEPELVAALALGAVDSWFRYRLLLERMAQIPAGDSSLDDQYLDLVLKLVPEVKR
ncbi:TetR/AcrR family transcriptional regulator [Fimbriimonas ginsengisoli]|uniref:TetR family transcriptional regulator n=1 Tax=Fimbriimonas ginsengisoli Gsoil 348 TaxID=661478 RepID=A0A068NRU2_FIMGI|nr:TetR family transcriptional regulator [Fimbriimonas ginsengisoli]AIE86273.1 TetR family transcriptional regulator [Fimbriimonas ginsengisoli Gsoil 348]